MTPNDLVGNPLPVFGGIAQQQMAGGYNPGAVYQGPFLTPSYSPDVYAPGARFRVEKIDNGFLVHLAKAEGAIAERHYAENEKAVGELVTATLVRWYIEGK